MEPILSQIILWPLSWEPQGWMFCRGQELSIQQYTALFSLLGTTYGGNGQTTFKLPDLRGRVPVGVNQDRAEYLLSAAKGNETVTISTNQLPAHSHSAGVAISNGTFKATTKGLAYNNSSGSTNIPADNTCLANGTTESGDKTFIYNTSASTGNMSGQDAVLSGNMSGTVSVGSTGAGQPVSIVQPYMALNYLIAVEGVYPTRP